MREEWMGFGWRSLALHLLHQRHEAVGVELAASDTTENTAGTGG
jgi:hypothetical protein